MNTFGILRRSYRIINALINSRFKSSHQFTLADINYYGSLIVRCPSVVAHVKPINPHDIPDGDKAFIHINSLADDVNLSNVFDVVYNKNDSVITVSENDDALEEIPNDLSLHIQIPHIYNIDIEALSVNIEETEGDILKLISQRDCVLGKIKSVDTDIWAKGSFNCKNFFGNGNLKVHGNICIRKLQSSKVLVEGEDIDIAAVYCPHFVCNTIDGNINIQNLHGTASISSQSGLITIGSSAGDFHIQTGNGNVEVTIEKCKSARILSESGDINVGLGSSVSTFIEAKAQYIDIPQDLLIDGMKEQNSSGYQNFEGKFGDGASTIHAHTKSGSIYFSRKSWYSSFKFSD